MNTEAGRAERAAAVPQETVSPEGQPILLTAQEFDDLAIGQWDEVVAQKLSNSEFSRVKLGIRNLLQEVQARPEIMGPLAPLDEVVDLLSEAEAQNPRVVRELLSHPPVGHWLAHTRNRLQGGVIVDEERPLWADIGYAHSLAAVAAHQTGLDTTIQVPAHDGRVMLPTLGRATLPSASGQGWQTAGVRTHGDLLVVSNGTDEVAMPGQAGTDVVNWEGARWLTFTASSGETWSVLLDDLDELSGLRGPLVPNRLSEAGVEAWREVLGGAWELLATHHAMPAGQIAGVNGLRVIVPQLPKPRFQTYSSSSGHSPGSATMSRPYDAVETAVTLIHEYCGHTLLNLLFHLPGVPLLQSQNSENQNYAPWRDDPRPPAGLLHGVKAFSVVADFWRGEHGRLSNVEPANSARRLAAFELAFWRDEVYNGALELLSRRAELTNYGEAFVQQLLVGLVEPLREVVIESNTKHRARALSVDHALRWGGHHLQVSETSLEEVARSWVAGSVEPPPEFFEQFPALIPNPNARGLDVAAVLVRLGIVSPELLNQPTMLPREATLGDVALATFLLKTTDFPAGRWDALKRVLPPLLEAHRGTPKDILSALHARISRDSKESPPIRAVTQWLAKGVLGHLQRRGDEMPLLPRYQREGDEAIIQESLRTTIRQVNSGELSVMDGARLLMALGFMGIGSAVSQKVYRPRVLVTNIPESGFNGELTTDWQPRIKGDNDHAQAVVRAGRDAFTAILGGTFGDAHWPFQREELGVSFLPPQWEYVHGYGGWVYRSGSAEGGYEGIGHEDFVNAVGALRPDMEIGVVDLVRDDRTFTEQVPFEPGHAASRSLHNTVGSLTVRAADAQALLPNIRTYSYPPRRRR